MAHLVVDGKELPFDLGKLLNVEVIALTKATGIKFNELGPRMQAMDYEAITAIVWILRKRTEPDLRIGDVTFPIDSFELVADEDDEPDPKDQTPESPPSNVTSQSSPTSSASTPGTSRASRRSSSTTTRRKPTRG